jgi:hypothetical protein
VRSVETVDTFHRAKGDESLSAGSTPVALPPFGEHHLRRVDHEVARDSAP